ncbi:MAG: hypothetical protein LBU34_13405 [Planctomycetaceae bacterium]|nr:hypothetical protein [Planctomycetaceae bacterium]
MFRRRFFTHCCLPFSFHNQEVGNRWVKVPRRSGCVGVSRPEYSVDGRKPKQNKTS